MGVIHKNYPAIIIFVCVDARGKLTHINAGATGQVGDAITWNKIDSLFYPLTYLLDDN
jgi:hypothetical protein